MIQKSQMRGHHSITPDLFSLFFLTIPFGWAHLGIQAHHRIWLIPAGTWKAKWQNTVEKISVTWQIKTDLRKTDLAVNFQAADCFDPGILSQV